MYSRVGHLERFAEHTSTSLTEVAEETKRIENNVDEKLTKEAHERLKLEMWGRKWNLVVRGARNSD